MAEELRLYNAVDSGWEGDPEGFEITFFSQNRNRQK